MPGCDAEVMQVSDIETTADEAETLEAPEPDDNIGWLELFFDLIAVAAVAVLTEGLREDVSLAGVGMFLLLYAAIWLSWVTVVMYANVAAERTRIQTVLIAMFLVAVMAAAAPSHFDNRANAFAVAFVLVRITVARGSLNTGRLLTSWPVLQFGGATAPWIVSLWVHAPAKYYVWAVALFFDLVMVAIRGQKDSAELAQRMNERFEQQTERSRRPARAARSGQPDDVGLSGTAGQDTGTPGGRRQGGGRQGGGRQGGGRLGGGQQGAAGPPKLVAVDVNRGHLDERLGLFVIIVLGEAVMGLVAAAATTEWSAVFQGTVCMAFVILVGIWWLTFSYGFAAAPHTRLATLPPRFGLPLHLISTIGIVCLAAGLGEMALHPDEDLSAGMAWITCAGLSLYFLVSGIGGITSRAPLSWVLGWVLPCTLAPLVLAAFGDRVPPELFTAILLAVVGWQVLYSLGAKGQAAGGRRT